MVERKGGVGAEKPVFHHYENVSLPVPLVSYIRVFPPSPCISPVSQSVPVT